MDTIDRAAEWRRLKEHYREMSEEELASVAEEAYELTDVARQALEAEITSRGCEIEVRDAPPDPEERRKEVVEEVDESDPDDEEFEFDPADLDLVVLQRVWDVEEARKAKAILDEAGIPSYLGDENAERVDDFKSGFAGGVDLKVRDQDNGWARHTLATRWPEEPAQSDAEQEYVPPQCPKCRSTDIVFQSRDSELTGNESFNARFRWSCDHCGNEWEDDGVVP